MDILDEIKNEHDKMKSMVADIEEAIEKEDSKSLDGMFDDLKTFISAHMDAEEDIFYPSIKEADNEAFYEAIEEHDLLRQEADKIKNIANDDEQWSAIFKVIKSLNEHHIEEEETNVFKIARKEIPEKERVEIGKRFDEVMNRQTNIKAGGKSSARSSAESSSGSR